MKRILISALVFVMGLGLVAMAGPLIGIQVAPAINSAAALTVGWDFGAIALEGSKTDFNTWYGQWSIAALWIPVDQAFSYRLGPKLIWNWNSTTGALVYKDLAIVLGVSRTWGAFQLFGELDIGSTGALNIKPLLGLNILFDGFFPQPVENEPLNLE